MILFRDPIKQAKLEEAIKRGFIIQNIDPDGIIRYTLTNQGLAQWNMEKMMGMRYE